MLLREIRECVEDNNRNPHAEFLTQEEYEKIAVKQISYYARNFNSIARNMLRDRDAIDHVIFDLMRADWRFEPNRKGNFDISKSRWSYRNQCGFWSISIWLGRQAKYRNKKVRTVNVDSKDISLLTQTTHSLGHDATYKMDMGDYILSILENSEINKEERDCIEARFWKQETFKQIAQRLGIPKHRAKLIYERAIKKMHTYVQKTYN